MDYISEAFAAGVWGRYQQTPHWVAWNHQNLSDNHCAVCLKLDDCRIEKGKAPPWEVRNMNMMDRVEVITEKEKYAKEGVHKGMQGWICIEPDATATVLVNFPQRGEKADIAEISIAKEDLKRIQKMDAGVNERIKAEWGE